MDLHGMMIWLLLWFVCFPFLSLQKHPRWWWRRALLPFSGIPGLCNVTRADLWTNKFYTDLFFFPLTILFATYRIALLLHWWEILVKFCCSLHILHLVAKALIGTIVAKHLFNCAQLCNCAIVHTLHKNGIFGRICQMFADGQQEQLKLWKVICWWGQRSRVTDWFWVGV